MWCDMPGNNTDRPRFLSAHRWSVPWVLDKLFPFFFDSRFSFFKHRMEYWSFTSTNKKEHEISTVYQRTTRTGSDAGRVKRKSPVCYCLNNSDYVIGHALPEESWQGKEDFLCKWMKCPMSLRSSHSLFHWGGNKSVIRAAYGRFW